LKVGIRLAFVVALATAAGPASADEPRDDGAARPIEGKIAVLELEALGMDEEPVARLETLFRMELERLAGESLPTRRQIDRAIRSSRRLRRCSGDDKCLAAIGKKLGVDLVVTGNVAALGDSYVLNIKAVDVATGQKLPRRIATKPLRGSPDELIEAVRVAAYKLLAPSELHGSINILSDLVGATVTLDGNEIGTTPIRRPIRKLPLGDHQLKVTADGYIPFDETVRVRFQKSSRVIVRLAKEDEPKPLGPRPVVYKKRPATKRWYNSTWFLVGAGVTAAVVGGVVGFALASDSVIDCNANPGQCGLPDM
jgi:hypothetical protein